MPNFLAMSFEGALTPTFELRCLAPGRRPPDGWGIGYYPGGEPSAATLKESAPSQESIRSQLVASWDHLASSIFVLHIRQATWGPISDANTQPFQRAWGRRDWLLAHSGSLDHRLELASRFEPVGGTDSEQIFCEMLARIANADARSLGDLDPVTLRDWFHAINEHGSLTSVITDGRDVCVYADRNGIGPAYVWELLPPHNNIRFGDEDLSVDLTARGVKSRKGVIISAHPLAAQGDLKPEWRMLAPGTLLMVRQGAIRAEVAPRASGEIFPVDTLVRARPVPVVPTQRAEIRAYDVVHRTAYKYDRPVERSSHMFRLCPIHDRLQTLMEHSLELSVPARQRDYDDVFGNRVRRLEITTPYDELTIVSRSRVEVLDTDPFSLRPLHARTTIPLVWMPWQRHMLQPFLLPPELPESELSELIEYAMSFVERNDNDLLDTVLDINATIFREYTYQQGSTTIMSTAFEAYANRRGVCQDFANLFICLARLLGIPARYVCGYLWTGPKAINTKQAEASHAWVQLYLPELGWKGFDPTNGILTQTNHIRVAVGRNYLDATPTSGTIFVGGGTETLSVDVSVEPVG